MLKSESLNELATSLVKAQAAIQAVSKDGKGYGYDYAKLEDVISVVKPKLNENGISFVQLIEESSNQNSAKVTTLLIHTSGQFLGSTGSIDVPEMKGCNLAQRHGAAQSYLKRYQLQALTGLPTEDNDASSEGFNKTKVDVTDKSEQNQVQEVKPKTTSFKRPQPTAVL